MRLLRLIALSLLLFSSAASAAVTHGVCEDMDADGMVMMHHAETMAIDHDGMDHEPAPNGDCCEGLCLCGMTVATAMSPSDPGWYTPAFLSAINLPSADDARGPVESFDLPPPRLG